MQKTSVGPGDNAVVNPVITNDAIEGMYVFIEIEMAVVRGEGLYKFDVDSAWVKVEENGGIIVYAYGNENEMTTLGVSERTSAYTAR